MSIVQSPASMPLSPDLLTVLGELGFDQLTAVQARSLPALLEGRDLIGRSRTGSGKTAAFSLPILQHVDLRDISVQALVLCPTRELATQVSREFRRLGRRKIGLRVLVACGGQPLREQSFSLRQGVHVVVGTPGRVLDLLLKGRLNLERVRTLVLDEADRMLEMGFADDMAMILERTPEDRQTVFFSATYPVGIEALSRRYQQNPVVVEVEDEAATQPAIRQIVCDSENDEKLKNLLKMLRLYRPSSALVFANLKTTVAELGEVLSREGFAAGALHGDLEQPDRDGLMASFRNGSVRVLVATDVAARGLDIEGLPLVVNYDLPHQSEVYVHRIGRTGRAGREGLAISLATFDDRLRRHDIEMTTGVRLEKEDWDPNKRMESDEEDLPVRTLSIAAGRKQKLRPGDILGALTGEAGGLAARQVGKIEIHDQISFVAVDKNVAETACQRLRDGRIKGQRLFVRLLR